MQTDKRWYIWETHIFGLLSRLCSLLLSANKLSKYYHKTSKHVFKVSVDVAIQELGSISETGETFLILINFYWSYNIQKVWVSRASWSSEWPGTKGEFAGETFEQSQIWTGCRNSCHRFCFAQFCWEVFCFEFFAWIPINMLAPGAL